MNPEANGQRKNLNTILLAIVIAVMLGNGSLTMQNTIKLAEISGSAMQRPEIESRMQQVRLDMTSLEAEIQKIKLDIVALQLRQNK